jgi:hypothetical protein
VEWNSAPNVIAEYIYDWLNTRRTTGYWLEMTARHVARVCVFKQHLSNFTFALPCESERLVSG